MVMCNEDVAGVDGSIECTWSLTSRLSNPTVQNIERGTRHLLRQIFVGREEFICPTTVETTASCLDPSRRLEPRRDRSDEKTGKSRSDPPTVSIGRPCSIPSTAWSVHPTLFSSAISWNSRIYL